jgi:hypothetical protein
MAFLSCSAMCFRFRVLLPCAAMCRALVLWSVTEKGGEAHGRVKGKGGEGMLVSIGGNSDMLLQKSDCCNRF